MASFDGQAKASSQSQSHSYRRGGGGGGGGGGPRRPATKGPHNMAHNPVISPLRKPRQFPVAEDYGDANCIVCYKDVKYYSVGACDHSVCHECSGRMRVLLEQNECPICRQKLENVIFTKGLKPYKELKDKLRMFIYLPKWGLYLEDEEVSADFSALLEHRCPFCKEEPFLTFKDLKCHVQRQHELYACDLCSSYIKLFSQERKFYNRADLGHHKRRGDKNDKSHKGHPLCQFCDRRWFDSDELYKHLRKDHYFCHFCDADGHNHYYNTYDDLRIHFRKEHWLCEEEHCKDEQFTSVFRSEIDMKAHLTTAHSRLLGKHGTKEARKIELEFNIASDDERRSRRFNGDGFVGRPTGRRDRDRTERGAGGDEEHDEERARENEPHFEPTVHPKPKFESVSDFPLLEGAATTPALPLGTVNANSSSIAQKLALSSGKNVSSSNNKSSGSRSGPGPQWNTKVTGSSKHDEEFPALGGQRQPSSSGPAQSRPFSSTAAASSSKPPPPATNGYLLRPAAPPPASALEEFPSLGKPSSNGGSAWAGSGVKMKGGRPTPRSLKVAPAPLERKVEVDPYDAFHFVPLSVSRARKDSLSKKYECIIAEDATAPEAFVEKRKKKNNKNVENVNKTKTIAAAASLFNDGKAQRQKSAPKFTNEYDEVDEDFPTLEPLKSSISNNGPPPGFSAIAKPQELFNLSFLDSKAKASSSSSNPPEDLELLKAVAGSSGKLYIQPPEFTRRSFRLMEAIKGSLNGDEESLSLFKNLSNQYREGKLSAKEYYELAQDMFGMMDFRIIFPELVALLPDIGKQQELLAAHRKWGGGSLTDSLSHCHECYQVIKNGDRSGHVASHTNGELFPAL